jgi:preprotein translocase subunit SecG
MYSVIIFLHILICALLIVVVLMQQSRGGGMSSVFGGGGGGTDSLFGGKGSTPFFIKLTTGLAIGFFFTSFLLVMLSRRSLPQSAVDKGLQELPAEQPLPEEPGPVIPEEPGPVIPGGG